MNKQLKCIIFDMDGTLTQTNRLIYESFNVVAEKYIHKRLTPNEIIALFGPPEEECIEHVVGAHRVERAMQDYYKFYFDEHNNLASLFPGVIEMLQFLRKEGVLLALFTGKGRRTTDITLERFALTEYFDITMTGDDVDEFKPSGDGIKKIMKRFSLQPNEVLMVGDAVADVKASRDAGVKIASVLWDSYGKEEVLQLKSDFVFHHVEELFRWLQTQYQQSV